MTSSQDTLVTRQCAWCKEVLPLDKFGSHKNSPDGVRKTCKECTNKRNRKSRQRDKSEKIVSVCENCGDEYEVSPQKKDLSKYCGQKCAYEKNYTKQQDPIRKKAMVVGANLLMGKGKLEFLMGLVGDAIGSKCIYCGEELSLDNMSIDHKEAYGSTKLRRSKAENRDIRKKMDRRENLQIICRPCNSIKNDIDHDDYLSFLEWSGAHPNAANSINRRLRISSAPFKRKK